MTAQALNSLLISALGLPASCRVDQRVPKRLLVESGAPTSADKRLINNTIEEIQWIAALKPNTVGVAEYRDDEREYLEVAVLCISARNILSGEGSGATKKSVNTSRLAELAHRAVPYPVLLLLTAPQGLFLSLAHKRWAQNDAGKVVLDTEPATVEVLPDLTAEHPFVQALALAHQPQASLLALYQGWMDCLTAWEAVQYTGAFIMNKTPAQAVARRLALHRCRNLDIRIASLRSTASKEKQMARQIAANLEIKALMAERQQVAASL